MGRLILLYVDEAIGDAALFGTVRDQAFNIMPKDSLITAGQRLCEKVPSQMAFRWEAVDKVTARCKKNLRPLAISTNFSSTDTQNPWLMALNWMKTVFSRQQTWRSGPLVKFLPTRYQNACAPICWYWMKKGKPPVFVATDTNSGFIAKSENASTLMNCISDDLVSMEKKADVLKKLDIPWLRQPLDESIDALYAELSQQ